jgi:hypothetical protein
MTFSITSLSISNTRHHNVLSLRRVSHFIYHCAESQYAECHYGECHYADCRGAVWSTLLIFCEQLGMFKRVQCHIVNLPFCQIPSSQGPY